MHVSTPRRFFLMFSVLGHPHVVGLVVAKGPSCASNIHPCLMVQKSFDHQLMLVVFPSFTKVLHVSTSAGFLSPTISLAKHQLPHGVSWSEKHLLQVYVQSTIWKLTQRYVPKLKPGWISLLNQLTGKSEKKNKTLNRLSLQCSLLLSA